MIYYSYVIKASELVLHYHICFRADPTATHDFRPDPPVKIAVARHRTEVLNILSEYTDTSDAQKLVKLLGLMYCQPYDISDNAEEFKKILPSLPFELVGEIF